MIDWIKNIFDKKEQHELIEWRTEDSIFNFICKHLDSDGSLNDSANDLPDENRNEDDDNELRYAPGLMDAMFSSTDSVDSKSRINELSKLLKKIALTDNKESKSKFYQLITSDENVIGIIDDFLQKIVSLSLAVEPYLFNFAKDLAFKTKHRNSVKFGLAIIGLCQNKSVTKEIKILGLHDEFTIFSTVALTNISDNIVNDLWELAKKVDGWGKIQLVDRLAKMKLLDEHKDWLIREGYKNCIMFEYLAYSCAINGDLHTKLQQTSIDNKLFKSTGEIIDALIAGGPAEDVFDYEYAALTIENFIRHAKIMVNGISDFLTLNRIKGFLIENQDDFGKQKMNGWSEEIISGCLVNIDKILKSHDWETPTLAALKSTDNVVFWKAKQAAEKLNIDIWETVWARLLNNPLDSSAWYDVTYYAKLENVDTIINFAIETIPLEELATGPKDCLGVGIKYIQYQPLDSIITFLENYPKKGEQLIITGLNSPVTRNRYMSIRTLNIWKSGNWSEAIREQLEKLKKIEPDKNIKDNIERLLDGKEIK